MQETARFKKAALASKTSSPATAGLCRAPRAAGGFRTQLEVPRKVFSVRITDKETKPAEKARLLYLLSEEANRLLN